MGTRKTPPADATQPALHKFEGKEVIGTKVKITGAGDGLSQALAIEPTELKLGETVLVLVECTVDKITHERVKDTNVAQRVQSLKASTATIVDAEFAGDRLEQQRIKIEQAKGVDRLDFVGDGEGGDDGSE